MKTNQIKQEDKIETIENDIKSLNQKQQHYDLQIQTIQTRIDDLFKDNNKNKTNIEREVETTKKEINHQKSFIKNITNSIDEIRNKLSIEIERNNEINIKNDELTNNQNNIQLSINQIKNKLNQEHKAQKIIECDTGIFQYLFDKHKMNPINIGLIEIKGNSFDFEEQTKLQDLIDPSWIESSWSSRNVKNSYIKIDFINSFVKINKYRLRVGWTTSKYLFKSWILRGITEEDEEIIIDEVQDSNEITREHPETTIELDKPKESFFKSIQLIIKGKNSEGEFEMLLRNIEIYGSLKVYQ